MSFTPRLCVKNFRVRFKQVEVFCAFSRLEGQTADMAYHNQYRPPHYNSAPPDQSFLWNIFQRYVKTRSRFRISTSVDDLTSTAGKSVFLQATYDMRWATFRRLYNSQQQTNAWIKRRWNCFAFRLTERNLFSSYFHFQDTKHSNFVSLANIATGYLEITFLLLNRLPLTLCFFYLCT